MCLDFSCFPRIHRFQNQIFFLNLLLLRSSIALSGPKSRLDSALSIFSMAIFKLVENELNIQFL